MGIIRGICPAWLIQYFFLVLLEDIVVLKHQFFVVPLLHGMLVILTSVYLNINGRHFHHILIVYPSFISHATTLGPL